MKCPMYLKHWKKHQRLMRWKRQQKRLAKIVCAVKIFALAKIRLDFFGVRKSASNHRDSKFHMFTPLGSWNENDEPLNLRHTRVTTVAHFHDVCFVFFSNFDGCLRAEARSCTISSSTSVTRSGSPPRIYQSKQSREKGKTRVAPIWLFLSIIPTATTKYIAKYISLTQNKSLFVGIRIHTLLWCVEINGVRSPKVDRLYILKILKRNRLISLLSFEDFAMRNSKTIETKHMPVKELWTKSIPAIQKFFRWQY